MERIAKVLATLFGLGLLAVLVGFKGLLGLDRHELTPAQGLGVSVALSQWPVLTNKEHGLDGAGGVDIGRTGK